MQHDIAYEMYVWNMRGLKKKMIWIGVMFDVFCWWVARAAMMIPLMLLYVCVWWYDMVRLRRPILELVKWSDGEVEGSCV